MAKKNIVSKKEQKLRDEYQKYLRGKKWGTKTKTAKESLKGADSYYVWKQKKLGKWDSKKNTYGAVGATMARRKARNKAYEEATGRKAK